MNSYQNINGLYLPNQHVNSQKEEVSKRFSKVDINNQGYKLAFLDTNILSDFKPECKEQLLQYFKSEKIIPVASFPLLGELLKGVREVLWTEKNLPIRRKKEFIIQTLQEMGVWYMLNHGDILALELENALYGKSVPGNENKIFVKVPLVRGRSDDPFPSYEGFAPFGLDSNHVLNRLFEDLEAIVKTFVEMVELNVDGTQKIAMQVEAARIQEQDLNVLRKTIDIGTIQKILSARLSLKEGDALFVYNQLLDSSRMPMSLYAPLWCVEDWFVWNVDIKNNGNPDKLRRDIMDSIHARIALSYCDYFITHDGSKKGKLQEKCKRAIKENDLSVEICDFDFEKVALIKV